MVRFPGLYRRPSGIYVVRLIVPARLRFLSSCAEIHASTRCKDFGEAKLRALQIQLHWRERFREWEMDALKLSTASALLGENGLLSIPVAAHLIGLSEPELLDEMAHSGVGVYIQAGGWYGRKVPSLGLVDRDDDGSFLQESVHRIGEPFRLSGPARCLESRDVIAKLRGAGTYRANENVYMLPESSAAFFVDWNDDQEVTAASCMIPKGAIERIRARLAANLTQEQIDIARASIAAPAAITHISSAVPSIIVYDPITAKHGEKRLSELFKEMEAKKSKEWKLETAKRMRREVGIFLGIMGDPLLREIDSDLISSYENKLMELPVDIRLARIKLKVDNLHELARATKRAGLPTKSSEAVRRHISTFGEVLSWAVSQHKMNFNPAANFGNKRGDDRKEEECRDVFSDDELKRIFSASWFLTGSCPADDDKWTPLRYWLPILAVYTGARLGEIREPLNNPSNLA